MDKVVSARIDEAVVDEMERVTHQLGLTKKQFLEDAIRGRARELSAKEMEDVWSATLGAWSRSEKAETTLRRGRKAFSDSFYRKACAGPTGRPSSSAPRPTRSGGKCSKWTSRPGNSPSCPCR